MSNVVVLGGGITGLTCAYYLSKLGRNVINKVLLLEKGTNIGGWLKSTRFPDGTIYEHGPKSMRAFGMAGFNSIALVEEIGLADEVLPVTNTHPAARRRLIMVNNTLHPLPTSFKEIFRKRPPLSHSFFYYGMKDIFTPKKIIEDESVHSFISRRFSQEMADYVFDPVVRGIVAGDSKTISVRSLFATLFKSEQEHGSVVKGQLKKGVDVPLGMYLQSNLATVSKKDKWSMWSLKRGMQSLPERVASFLEDDDRIQILTNTPCDRIHFDSQKAYVHFEGESSHTPVDHIFSCIPAKNLSRLVTTHHPIIGKHLSSIHSVHVAVVNLEYEGKVLSEQGFGFLIPSNQESKLLGITFDSCCFPAHDGKYADKTRITCMMGGHWFNDIFGSIDQVSQDKLLETAIAGARNILKIKPDPVRHKVNVMRHCIPQYKVGHHEILTNIHNDISKDNMCLSLLGCSYEGVSVNDCIYVAKQAVEKYAKNYQN